MLNPKFGTVKFFKSTNVAPDRKYGFIIPDDPDPQDPKDVYFRYDTASSIVEDQGSKLDFQLDTEFKREPKVGDRLVYKVVVAIKGLMAQQWNYEEEWQNAQAFIATRPWPEWLLCRVIRQDKEPPHQKHVLWEGYQPLLWEMMVKGDVPFVQPDCDWYKWIWIEEQKYQGWQRMYNPYDQGTLYSERAIFKDGLVVPENQRLRIQRFELARLICEGEKLGKGMKMDRYTASNHIFYCGQAYSVSLIGYALLAKFKDAKRAYELFSKREQELPISNPWDLRGDYVCAELLGLPLPLVRAAAWQAAKVQYDFSRLAQWLRQEDFNIEDPIKNIFEIYLAQLKALPPV